jgi:uroporphyrinogen decarboxylase
MNRRDIILDLIHSRADSGYVPAAFFMHFDAAHHTGQAAIDRHLEFFRQTGMDFVKIQYEQGFPACPRINQPGDWVHVPLVTEEYFDATLRVVAGLVKAAANETLVVMTLYSPFMWATHLNGGDTFSAHLQENPEAVLKGLEIMTENVLRLVRGCKQAGVDGFYASTQGGEAFRFAGSELFRKYIKPSDLRVWEEMQGFPFNILHICDYEGGYADLAPFLDYPGHAVNCSLKLGEGSLTPGEVSSQFGRPFMGGLERKGVIANGDAAMIRREVEEVLQQAPERFILAADCTVPSETPWENLRTAIAAAHKGRG